MIYLTVIINIESLEYETERETEQGKQIEQNQNTGIIVTIIMIIELHLEKVSVMPDVFGALDTVPKNLEKKLGE